MTRPQSMIVYVLLVVSGCGQQAKESRPAAEMPAASADWASGGMMKNAGPLAAESPMRGGMGMEFKSVDRSTGLMGQMAGMGGQLAAIVTDGTSATNFAGQMKEAQAIPASASTAASGISRKIVYDAKVELVVESVDPIATKIGSLVQQARGYIAEQSVSGSPGSKRAMQWRFRVPVDQFDSFVESVVALGELVRNDRTSQDITEQYYDIEARIKNKKTEEATLNKILQERSGKLEDVLKIEMELSRVRGEIEQLEGRIRVLENISSLATLSLNVREREQYAPAAPIVADFRTQMTRTWDGSVSDLIKMAKSVVLWVVSMVVWIPFLLVGALVAWMVLRRLLRMLIRAFPRIVAVARTPITLRRAPGPSE